MLTNNICCSHQGNIFFEEDQQDNVEPHVEFTVDATKLSLYMDIRFANHYTLSAFSKL